MNCRMRSFPRPELFYRLSFLVAIVALPALEAVAQARSDIARFQKASLKLAKPCTIGSAGEVTALVKNGVELSVNEDFDCDGVPDAYDNCVGMPNRDQADTNQNGIGDACEAATTIKAPPSKKRSVPIAKVSSKNRSDKKTKNRKAIAADRHSRPNARGRRRR